MQNMCVSIESQMQRRTVSHGLSHLHGKHVSLHKTGKRAAMWAHHARALHAWVFSKKSNQLSIVSKNYALTWDVDHTQWDDGWTDSTFSNSGRTCVQHIVQWLRIQQWCSIPSIWHEMWSVRRIQHQSELNWPKCCKQHCTSFHYRICHWGFEHIFHHSHNPNQVCYNDDGDDGLVEGLVED